MDDQLLDAICERLVSTLSIMGTYVVLEDDPVNEMLFIIRGQLESSTTNGGRSGFFNSITLGPNDFCGEELLTWALLPNSTQLPASTRTVRTLSEVEAFALRAEDLKFFAVQFKRLHSMKLQHAFRYYSHQWRTWGACFIQAAWRRYMKKKMEYELALQESYYYNQDPNDEGNYNEQSFDDAGPEQPLVDSGSRGSQQLGATILAKRFAANTRRGIELKMADSSSSLKMPKLFKPDEPDFSAE
uniref:Cyclic nucleotide-gated ion channel 18 n=3 Tax=Solanum TaxID=4107 RepID=M0ZIH0_SOLTU